MNCPTCPDSTLTMTDRSGIEIDYCPTCRGVWLDRGELDKIIERSTPDTPIRNDDSDTDRGRDRDRDDRDRDRYGDRDRSRSRSDGGYDDRRPRGDRDKRRKKESLLGDLFDF